MATFNGRDWTVADMLPFKYVENWDDFFDDVIAEMSARTAAVGSALTSASTTSLSIGTGSKSLTVGANKAFAVGQFVSIAVTADATKYMFGAVTSYNISTGALEVTVSDTAGSGTYAAWTVSLVGPKGTTGGATLPPGSAASPGLAVTGDPDTGLAQINGADSLSLIAGGFEIISWIKGLLGLRNNDASATGKTSITLGNSSDGLDAQIILNNAANTAMSGARSLNILANAGKIGLWFNRLAPTLGVELSSSLATFGVPAKAKQASVAYAPTITLDFAAQDYVIGDLTGPLTIANPSAYPVGQRGEILLHEDGTGGRTVSFGANWIKIGKDTVNTAAGKYSVITYWVVSGSVVIYSIAGGA